MSSTQDTPKDLIPVAPAALPTPNSADAVDPTNPAVTDLPSLHHAKIASARRYADASRHKSMQVLAGYVRNAELFQDHAGKAFCKHLEPSEPVACQP